MFSSFWRHSVSDKPYPSKGTRQEGRRSGDCRFRPRLEELEGRVLLSAGDLDPSFGTGGKVTTNFGPSSMNAASALALQSDGKMVVAGTTAGSSGRPEFAIARYNADGTLDPTFGSGGKVITDIDQQDFASGVIVQADGKIVVAGYSGSGGNTDGSMVRYNPDGSLDTSFGTGGKVTHLFSGQLFTRATALTIQPDNKIVVVGGSIQSTSSFFYIARVNANGSMDTSFGTGGRVSIAGGGATSVALQPDGKMVLAGAGLLRLNADGSQDSAFGTGGQISTSFTVGGVVLEPDGSVVVAGGNFALARYDLNGTLDTTFGNNGQVVTDFPGAGAFGLALQRDGRFVVAGTVAPAGSSSSMALARYNPNGSLDTTFGAAGKVVTSFGAGNAGAAAVVVQTDGRIVAAGQSPSNNREFAVARYLGDTRIASDSQRFVSQVYLDLLQRPADSAGLANWSSAIDRGQLSRTQVVSSIETSPEYHMLEIKRLYVLLLRRSADSSGLGAFTTFLNQGGSAEQVATVIMGSDEYFNRGGGGSNTGLVQAIYRDILHRAADPSGSQSWTQALNSGTPRGTVAGAILNSPESSGDRVQALYRQFLRRAVDPTGLAGFTSALQHGTTNDQVAAALIGSDEYFGQL
jgi:uncharacterized delta-60 repeat protein